MTVMIMIDSSINPNPMLGFELYTCSSHVIEKRYKLLHSTNCVSVNCYLITWFVWVMANLESHGILQFHFPGLESHGI